MFALRLFLRKQLVFYVDTQIYIVVLQEQNVIVFQNKLIQTHRPCAEFTICL